MIRLAVGLFLIAIPVLELALLIKIGQAIGVWATVALVVAAAFTGILIISRQSFSVLRQSLEAMNEGRPPVIPVLDGLFLIAAGVLLLTPGLITDALALPLLIPPVRRAVAHWSVGRLLKWRMDFEAEDAAGATSRHAPDAGAWGKGPIIEGEFERVGDAPKQPRYRNGATPPTQDQA